MLGGAAEPLYLPAQNGGAAALYYREDFAASALHEAAHWCIAGRARRDRVDFGYDYQPPPRTEQAQDAFFASEVKTQALECLFAQAANVEFRASADNLHANVTEFEDRLDWAKGAVENWLMQTTDTRARRFLTALASASEVSSAAPDTLQADGQQAGVRRTNGAR